MVIVSLIIEPPTFNTITNESLIRLVPHKGEVCYIHRRYGISCFQDVLHNE